MYHHGWDDHAHKRQVAIRTLPLLWGCKRVPAWTVDHCCHYRPAKPHLHLLPFSLLLSHFSSVAKLGHCKYERPNLIHHTGM